MKLHNLRDFVAIAKCGGIRAAARHLNLSQPALSKSISQLESELGTPLFERTARGSALNSYGERFLVRAEAAIHELNRGREEVTQLRGDTGGSVSFAVSSVVAMAFLTNALSRFRKRFPLAHVQLYEGNHAVMLRGLRERSLDFVVGPVPDLQIADDLAIEHLFDNERLVLARKDHPLHQATSLRQLADAEWLTTSVLGPRDNEFRGIFEFHGLQAPTSITRCDSLIALMAIIADTDAIAFLPRQWADSQVTRSIIAAIPIMEKLPGPATCLIRPSAMPLTPAAESLADAIRNGAMIYREAGVIRQMK